MKIKTRIIEIGNMSVELIDCPLLTPIVNPYSVINQQRIQAALDAQGLHEVPANQKNQLFKRF